MDVGNMLTRLLAAVQMLNLDVDCHISVTSLDHSPDTYRAMVMNLTQRCDLHSFLSLRVSFDPAVMSVCWCAVSYRSMYVSVYLVSTPLSSPDSPD